MNYKFPSGLKINYESNIIDKYIEERNKISNQQDLINFQNKWKYLFPEINDQNLNADIFIEIRDDIRKQTKNVKEYFNLLMPSTLLLLAIKAKKFNVPIGLVILQLWNAGMFDEQSDGTWKLII